MSLGDKKCFYQQLVDIESEINDVPKYNFLSSDADDRIYIAYKRTVTVPQQTIAVDIDTDCWQ